MCTGWVYIIGMTRKQTTQQAAAKSWSGMNWIRQEKRLAIYLRDDLCCAYCGSTIEDGATLSLDHLTPRSKGGSNEATNLVTCCTKCNSSRGNRPVKTFVDSVAAYLNHGCDAKDIMGRIRRIRRRNLTQYIKQAKAMRADAGTWK